MKPLYQSHGKEASLFIGFYLFSLALLIPFIDLRFGVTNFILIWSIAFSFGTIVTLFTFRQDEVKDKMRDLLTYKNTFILLALYTVPFFLFSYGSGFTHFQSDLYFLLILLSLMIAWGFTLFPKGYKLLRTTVMFTLFNGLLIVFSSKVGPYHIAILYVLTGLNYIVRSFSLPR